MRIKAKATPEVGAGSLSAIFNFIMRVNVHLPRAQCVRSGKFTTLVHTGHRNIVIDTITKHTNSLCVPGKV